MPERVKSEQFRIPTGTLSVTVSVPVIKVLAAFRQIMLLDSQYTVAGQTITFNTPSDISSGANSSPEDVVIVFTY